MVPGEALDRDLDPVMVFQRAMARLQPRDSRYIKRKRSSSSKHQHFGLTLCLRVGNKRLYRNILPRRFVSALTSKAALGLSVEGGEEPMKPCYC